VEPVAEANALEVEQLAVEADDEKTEGDDRQRGEEQVPEVAQALPAGTEGAVAAGAGGGAGGVSPGRTSQTIVPVGHFCRQAPAWVHFP
jgi:hypothetical protein